VAVPLETCSNEDFVVYLVFTGKKHVSPHHCSPPVDRVYGNGVMKVQHVIKWWKDLKNGQMNILDDDCAS